MHVLLASGRFAAGSIRDTDLPHHLYNWWSGPVTHGDVLWIAAAFAAAVVISGYSRRIARIWGERIRVRRLPNDVLDVRITGTTAQVEAAMTAWLSRGKDGRL